MSVETLLFFEVVTFCEDNVKATATLCGLDQSYFFAFQRGA